MADTSGRWSTEEHNRFLLGMDLYGKKWTKVAEFVRTRSTVQVITFLKQIKSFICHIVSRQQVRSHAQKHFQKVGKNGPENTNDDFEERPFQKRRLNIDILRRVLLKTMFNPHKLYLRYHCLFISIFRRFRSLLPWFLFSSIATSHSHKHKTPFRLYSLAITKNLLSQPLTQLLTQLLSQLLPQLLIQFLPHLKCSLRC